LRGGAMLTVLGGATKGYGGGRGVGKRRGAKSEKALSSRKDSHANFKHRGKGIQRDGG